MIPKMSAPKRGRKPLPDKKQAVRLYLLESRIKAMGGIDKAQAKIYQLIESNHPVKSKP